MGFFSDISSAIFGKKGDDPQKLAAKGLNLLPGMEKRQLMQSVLMQKLLQDQKGDLNKWEKRALQQLIDDERAATMSTDAAAKREGAKVSEGVSRAGLSGVLGGVVAKSGAIQRTTQGRLIGRANRGREAIGVRQAAMAGRGGIRQNMIGVHENIQRAKAASDLQKLHLTTGNAPVNMQAMLKAPNKGLLGTALGVWGLASGGPEWGAAGQAAGDSIGSVFAK